MLIDRINLNNLRIFEAVYRSKSMTVAADELHLTQSGVSQHIKSLEDALEVVLFDRVKKKLVPTDKAKELYELSSKALMSIEAGLAELKGGAEELKGTVRIGVPDEYGYNVVQPLLIKFAKENPGINFKLSLGLGPEMSESLLAGELDFAFVDDFKLDNRISKDWVYDEELNLCCLEDYAKENNIPAKPTKKQFEEYDYVAYQESEAVLQGWFKHHFKGKNPRLNIRACVVAPQLVARFIVGGIGLGVMPNHLYRKLVRQGHKIKQYTASGKPLKNSIQIAYLKERTSSHVALILRDWLIKEIHSLKKP